MFVCFVDQGLVFLPIRNNLRCLHEETNPKDSQTIYVAKLLPQNLLPLKDICKTRISLNNTQ